MRQPIHDGLIGVFINIIFIDPALWGSGNIGVVFRKISLIGNTFSRRKNPAGQSAESGDHFKDGAGSSAGMNRIIQQKISGIAQDRHGLFSAGNQCVQIIGWIIGAGQHTALHIQDNQAAVFRKSQRILGPVPVMDIAFIGFLPGGRGQILFLQIPGGINVFLNAAFGNLLIGSIQRKLYVIAILWSGIRQFAHNSGHLVPFDNPLAFTQ